MKQASHARWRAAQWCKAAAEAAPSHAPAASSPRHRLHALLLSTALLLLNTDRSASRAATPTNSSAPPRTARRWWCCCAAASASCPPPTSWPPRCARRAAATPPAPATPSRSSTDGAAAAAAAAADVHLLQWSAGLCVDLTSTAVDLGERLPRARRPARPTPDHCPSSLRPTARALYLCAPARRLAPLPSLLPFNKSLAPLLR